jgi:hypothetical protein
MKTFALILVGAAAAMSVCTPAPAFSASQSDSLGTVARPDTARAGVEAPKQEAAPPPARKKVSPGERARLKRTLQMMGRREVEGTRLWQRRKSPKLAMYCNALLPGLGQVYNGRRIKTALMVAAASYYIGNIWLNQKNAQRYTATRDNLPPDGPGYKGSVSFYNGLISFYKEQAKDYLWWSAAVWVIGILDAWIDAHLYDIRAYTPPQTAGAFIGPKPVPYVTLSFSF